MITKPLLAVAVLLSIASSAQAETLFRGTIRVTGVTAGCTQGPNIGDQDNAQFHSALVPGNVALTALNRISTYGGTSWRLLAPGGFTTSFQQVSNLSFGWSDFTPSKPTFILVTKQTPATLAATSASVVLTGRIRNYFGNTGQDTCIANFTFAGVLSN